ncbi:MAG: hypothetical protein LBI03_10110 [Clostridiales bacterium]|jgi:hypothetical protein|nr:hypothetical protein [Clostridiales bacterium]
MTLREFNEAKRRENDCGCRNREDEFISRDTNVRSNVCRRGSHGICDIVDCMKDIKEGINEIDVGKSHVFEGIHELEIALKDFQEGLKCVDEGEKDILNAVHDVENGLCDLLKDNLY